MRRALILRLLLQGGGLPCCCAHPGHSFSSLLPGSLSFSSQAPRLTEQAPVQAQLCVPQEPGCMSEGGGVASLLSGTQ